MTKIIVEKENAIKSFKGFDKNFKCRDFQFEEGKEYEHKGDVKCCESGFHACEYPLDIFNYYAPADSVFAEVEQFGATDKHNEDSKIASSNILIKAKIKLQSIIEASVKFTFSKTTSSGAASNSGYRGAEIGRAHV